MQQPRDFRAFLQLLQVDPWAYQESLLQYQACVENLPFSFQQTGWQMIVRMFLTMLETGTENRDVLTSITVTEKSDSTKVVTFTSPHQASTIITIHFYWYENAWRIISPVAVEQLNNDLVAAESLTVLAFHLNRSNVGGGMLITFDTNGITDVLGNGVLGYDIQPDPQQESSSSYSISQLIVFEQGVDKRLVAHLTKSDPEPVTLGCTVYEVAANAYTLDKQAALQTGTVVSDISQLQEYGDVRHSAFFGYQEIELSKPLETSVTLL